MWATRRVSGHAGKKAGQNSGGGEKKRRKQSKQKNAPVQLHCIPGCAFGAPARQWRRTTWCLMLDALAGRVNGVPGGLVDRHHRPVVVAGRTALGSEGTPWVLLCGEEAPKRPVSFRGFLSLAAATSVLRVPKHEWNASSGGRCTRETTTDPEWNGPGRLRRLAQEWAPRSSGPSQGLPIISGL